MRAKHTRTAKQTRLDGSHRHHPVSAKMTQLQLRGCSKERVVHLCPVRAELAVGGRERCGGWPACVNEPTPARCHTCVWVCVVARKRADSGRECGLWGGTCSATTSRSCGQLVAKRVTGNAQPVWLVADPAWELREVPTLLAAAPACLPQSVRRPSGRDQGVTPRASADHLAIFEASFSPTNPSHPPSGGPTGGERRDGSASR